MKNSILYHGKKINILMDIFFQKKIVRDNKNINKQNANKNRKLTFSAIYLSAKQYVYRKFDAISKSDCNNWEKATCWVKNK